MKSAYYSTTGVVLITLATIAIVQCQQYVPIQILIPNYGYNFSNISNSYRPNYNNTGYIPGYSNINYPNYGNYNYSNGSSGYRPGYNYSYGNQYPSYGIRNTTNSSGYNETRDGHLFVGQFQLYDRLLFSQVYRKESRWWGTRETNIEFPQDLPPGYTRNERVSAVRIYNQFLDGNSARASILKGGIGYQYVKIKLESKWGKGFQYLVQIFGH